MVHRHLQTLIAVFLAGLWGAGVYFAHDRGHLRFLDRIESTMIDFRTLVRGVKIPPDVVTIVAIDDTVVKHGGSYPVARAELAKIVDAIAQSRPKVIAVDLLLIDRGIDDGDEALAKARFGQMRRQPQPQAAGDDDGVRSLRQRQIAGDPTERQAETVERRSGKAVGARQRRSP